MKPIFSPPIRPVLFILILIATVGSPAQAGLITSLAVQETPAGGGMFNYEYMLQNDPRSTLDVSALEITVSKAADLNLIGGPLGWDVSYSPGGLAIDWNASDLGFDITPGASATFSFGSLLDATPQDFTVGGIGFNDSTITIDFNYGKIASPGATPNGVTTPEPSSLVLGAIGIFGLLAYSWQRLKLGSGMKLSVKTPRPPWLSPQAR